MKKIIFLFSTLLALSGCGQPDNPLLVANDGQFLRLSEGKRMAYGEAPSCAAALYQPEKFIKKYNSLIWSKKDEISAVSEKQKMECIQELLIRASEIGIKGDITKEHLFDNRVKQRYVSLNKG